MSASAGSAAERLSSEGIVVVVDLCDQASVSKMLAVCGRRLDEARRALGSRDIGIGSAAGYDEIVQRSPGRWDVPFPPEEFGIDHREMPWWPLVAEVLGDDAEVPFSGLVSSEPGSPSQHWHSDSPHEAPEHRAPHALNVLVALHDIPMEMGPTEFATGSHVLTNHLSNTSLVVEQLIYQHEATTPETLVEGTGRPIPEARSRALASGACVVFDDRILHRGMANGSDQIRHVAYFSYCRSGYDTNTYFESGRSVFDASR